MIGPLVEIIVSKTFGAVNVQRVVDYFFSIGSAWAYLGHNRLKRLSETHALAIRPKPITILPENGAISLRERPAARGQYWFTDLKRWADYLDIPLALENRPAGDWMPASFMVMASIVDGQDWWTLCEALQKAWWTDARDISDPKARVQVADEAGFDGAALLARDGDADIREAWAANIRTATEIGVFGSPTYVFEGELYWGQDSLFFLERALTRSRQPALYPAASAAPSGA